MFRFHFASLKVYVGQSVKFGDNYLDIIGTNAMGDSHNLFPFIPAAYRMKLARMDVIIDLIEIGCHHVDATGIAYENYIVVKLIGTQMNMKH